MFIMCLSYLITTVPKEKLLGHRSGDSANLNKAHNKTKIPIATHFYFQFCIK